MLFSNRFSHSIFYCSCWHISLVVFFLTSAMPLNSTEDITYPKGLLDNLNPEKKIKELKNYVKTLESFTEQTSFKDLSKFMNSLKRFTEKEIGKKISSDDISFEVNKRLNELNIPLNPKIVRSCLAKLIEKENRKTLIQEEEFVGNPQIALGCVFLASAIHIGAVGFAVPPLAPFCTANAQTIAGVGIGF